MSPQLVTPPQPLAGPLALLTGAPFWVWPLLVLLVALGLRATRERVAASALVYALPLLGLVSAATLARLPNLPLVLAAHLAGYGAGLALGYRVQRRWLLEKRRGRVRLAGEWLTLAAMLILFGAGFVNGVVAAIAPEVHAGAAFLAGFAVITGLASGSFGGRALRTALAPAAP